MRRLGRRQAYALERPCASVNTCPVLATETDDAVVGAAIVLPDHPQIAPESTLDYQDTGYFDGFKQIGQKYGPFDVTLLETGAYDAQWPFVHMQPEQTLQAHLDLGGRWLLPIHNGTFDLAMHAWHEPFDRLMTLAWNRCIGMSTPMMGEQLNLRAPHAGTPWWLDVQEGLARKVKRAGIFI